MAKGGYRGGMPMGGRNQMQMMKQAQKMQENLMKMQEELQAKEYEATAGGGVIKAVCGGDRELKSITIDPEAVDPEDVEMLQDMIVAAVNEAMRKAVLMRAFPAALERLTEQFARLPGIGMKSAQRLAFYVLSLPKEDADSFAQAIVDAKNSVRLCPVCQNLTDQELCGVCADPERDHSLICVVAEPKDVIAMERAREYHGVYHVLHGVISPLSHVGPDDLRIRELISRVSQGGVREVIMATNPDTEGEATAMYLSRLLRPMDVKVTRLAYGIPVGSQLEYADEVTLLRALEGRQEI